MSPLLGAGDFLSWSRALPRHQPEPEPEPVQILTTQGTWRPEPGMTYLTARDIRAPRWPDRHVFGPPPPWAAYTPDDY